jgi:predicted Zn-dependent protease
VLVSSTGQRAVTRTTTAQLDAIVRATTDGPPADGLGHATSVRLADLDGAAAGAVATGKARAGATAVDVPPGTWPVVLEPKAVAAALLFPAYLGFNGKAHADGTSFVHLGEAQWDPSVHIWDDATDPRALGGQVDAEGTPKRRTDLVRGGVSVGLAHDRRSARLAGVEPTGHSIGSDAFGGYPSDLFLGGGSVPAAEVIAGLDRGLLVTDLWYNRVLDPKSQVVTGLTRNGLFLVEGGVVVSAVRNLRYTQSIAAAFGPGRVLALADDARLVGRPRSDGMHVPTVHLAAWSFTGDARG